MQSKTYLVPVQVAHLGNCVVHGYSLNTSKTDLLHGGCRQHISKLAGVGQHPKFALHSMSAGSPPPQQAWMARPNCT